MKTLKKPPFRDIADFATAGLDCLCCGQGLFFMKESDTLRSRFIGSIERNWIQNDHSLKNISCVYAIVGYALFAKEKELFYIGSTTKLLNRYTSHHIPVKVQDLDYANILYYIPMDTGFYEYEKKLIGKLQPILNIQHKRLWR